jgi:gliding motility-associated-like protein
MENKGNGRPINSSVQIYDRYGKLIIELNSSNYSWDGKYNSKIYLQMIIGTT